MVLVETVTVVAVTVMEVEVVVVEVSMCWPMMMESSGSEAPPAVDFFDSVAHSAPLLKLTNF